MDAGPSGAWADLDFTERVTFMTRMVRPTMRDIFQARDPELYEDFDCESCHGPDGEANDYEMPTFLYPLPLEGTLEAAEARDPELTAFMVEEVHPAMAALLGEARFNASTAPDGFRCTRCHQVEEEDD